MQRPSDRLCRICSFCFVPVFTRFSCTALRLHPLQMPDARHFLAKLLVFLRPSHSFINWWHLFSSGFHSLNYWGHKNDKQTVNRRHEVLTAFTHVVFVVCFQDATCPHCRKHTGVLDVEQSNTGGDVIVVTCATSLARSNCLPARRTASPRLRPIIRASPAAA